jgi:predicted RNA binding protein YcfA (HicA-like mRNA interferase family)
MSQFDKLLQRIKSLDKNMRFDEVRKVLEAYGYTMSGPGSGSSHKTFRKPGCQPVTIPAHEPIKRIYIIMVKEAIESEENDEENN